MSNYSIGMMRSSGRPGEKARAMAYVAQCRNLKFYYFSPQDVDLKTQRINAKKLVEDKWVRVVIDYPQIIDNDTSSLRYKEQCDSLERIATFTTQILGGKLKTINLLKDNNIFTNIIIPYVQVKSKSDFILFLKDHHYSVLKPIRGNQGKNIFFIQVENNEVEINFDGKVKKFNVDKLDDFYDQNIKGHNFIIQKYIASKTNHGSPFDIRIHVQRDGGNKWNTTKIYARIGSSNAMTANISAGGSMALASSFIKSTFEHNAELIIQRLTDIAEKLPSEFQKFYSKNIDSLGIDLGVDREGNIWLFEINSFPGSKFFEFERALTRIDYLKYLLDQKSN